MYKLKKLIERGTTLGAAIALGVGAVVPAVVPAIAHADALNPLTDRSLTLSSSSPGWSHTDGSENPTYAPPNSGANGQKTGNYFDFKVSSTDTVKTFSFQYCKSPAGQCYIPGNNSGPGYADSSTTSDLNVEYPTATEVGASAAGDGTISLSAASTAVSGSSANFVTNGIVAGDLITTAGGNTYKVASVTDEDNLVISQPAAATEAGVTYQLGDFAGVVNTSDTNGKVKYVPGYAGYSDGKPGGQTEIGGVASDVDGNFIVMYWDGAKWVQSTGWTIGTANVNDVGDARPSDNYITLTSSTGVSLTAGQRVKVLFFATDDNYITNPGEGAFFVRMNTYKVQLGADRDDFNPLLTGQFDLSDLAPEKDTYIIDGGVTVANVMNQSIWIQTKVLETMQFSVGTVDPNTLPSDDGDNTPGSEVPSTLEKALNADTTGLGGETTHNVCDDVLGNITPNEPYNVLKMGDPTAEFSLSANASYTTHSYWRLSSNSSAGATVYYSGHTLTNTVGDQIDPIGPTKKYSARGAEQFGLAISTVTNSATDASGLAVKYYDAGTDSGANVGESGNDVVGGNLVTAVDASTDDGSNGGDVGGNASWHMPTLYPLVPYANYNEGTGSVASSSSGARFAFDSASDTVPVPIASESSQVVDCVTAKMRYVANVAATTPAGIYTTKVNYIAAPQY